MRAGRFGSKAGRVAVVVALVLGTLVAGAAAANAEDLDLTTSNSVATDLGQQAQLSVDGVAHAMDTDWN